MVRIVTDSTADLPADLVAELGVTVVPLNVHFGDETFRDRVDLSDDELIARLRRGPGLPKTSQPPVGAFEQAYRVLLPDPICSIHIGREISGTIGAARLAVDLLGSSAIALVDSRTLTMGLGWLVVAAARIAQRGGDLAECEAAVRERIPRARVIAMLDTLEFVRRGGRISTAAWILGSMLAVKPIVSVEDSQVLPLARVRTSRAAIDFLVRQVDELGPWEDLCVLHADNAAAAAPVVEAARAAMAHQAGYQVRLLHGGTVICTHAGPGAVAIAGIQVSR